MTKLKSIQYSLFESFNNKEWVLEKCLFEQVNLIVGRNASGKTRVLNTVVELADIFKYRYDLSREVTVKLIAEFEVEGEKTLYEIQYGRDKILHEKLAFGDIFTLERDELGRVESIYGFEKSIKDSIRVTDTMLGNSFGGEDKIIQFIKNWADYFSYYPFAGNLGQFQYKINHSIPKDAAYSVSKFIAGRERFRTDFNDLIIDNMAKIGYEIKEIGVERSILENDKVAKGVIYIIEKESSTRIYQYEMSQGMFRALSLIIQVNYTILAQNATCIVIDDIGEGLDHERAKKLIELLIQKSEDSDIQLIMATNDRFVMNTVPLKYWTILDRKGHQVKTYNYQTHKELFDEFEDMGLSNFDFFSSEFYRHGFEELDKVEEEV